MTCAVFRKHVFRYKKIQKITKYKNYKKLQTRFYTKRTPRQRYKTRIQNCKRDVFFQAERVILPPSMLFFPLIPQTSSSAKKHKPQRSPSYWCCVTRATQLARCARERTSHGPRCLMWPGRSHPSSRRCQVCLEGAHRSRRLASPAAQNRGLGTRAWVRKRRHRHLLDWRTRLLGDHCRAHRPYRNVLRRHQRRWREQDKLDLIGQSRQGGFLWILYHIKGSRRAAFAKPVLKEGIVTVGAD